MAKRELEPTESEEAREAETEETEETTTETADETKAVFVNVQDIFNWGAKIGSGSSNTNPYYLTDNTNKMLNSRYISVGVTFRFGKMELEKSAKEGSSESGDTLE